MMCYRYIRKRKRGQLCNCSSGHLSPSPNQSLGGMLVCSQSCIASLLYPAFQKHIYSRIRYAPFTMAPCAIWPDLKIMPFVMHCYGVYLRSQKYLAIFSYLVCLRRQKKGLVWRYTACFQLLFAVTWKIVSLKRSTWSSHPYAHSQAVCYGLSFSRQICGSLQKEFYIPQVGLQRGPRKGQVILNESHSDPLSSSGIATQLATNEDWQIVLAGYRFQFAVVSHL